MKKFLILLVIVGLVMGISAYSLAWGGRGGMMGGGRPGYGPNYQGSNGYYAGQQLDLTAEQTEQINELRDQLAEKSEGIQEQWNDKREELHDLYFSAESSQEEIDAVQNEINDLRDQLRELREDYMLQLRDVLTAEQLDKIDDGAGLYGLGMGPRAGFGPQTGPNFRGPGGYRNFGGPGFRGRGCYGAYGNYGMGRPW